MLLRKLFDDYSALAVPIYKPNIPNIQNIQMLKTIIFKLFEGKTRCFFSKLYGPYEELCARSP